MYYCALGAITVVGSSPEALVKLSGGQAQLRPIAGTRPRADDPATDVARELELSRAVQDAWAYRSHQRAVAAADAGRFDAELVPVGELAFDEAPRPGSRGTTVAFVHPKTSFGTLIELVQE